MSIKEFGLFGYFNYFVFLPYAEVISNQQLMLFSSSCFKENHLWTAAPTVLQQEDSETNYFCALRKPTKRGEGK